MVFFEENSRNGLFKFLKILQLFIGLRFYYSLHHSAAAAPSSHHPHHQLHPHLTSSSSAWSSFHLWSLDEFSLGGYTLRWRSLVVLVYEWFGIHTYTYLPDAVKYREENNLMMINLVTLKVQIIYEYDFDAHLSQITNPISQPTKSRSSMPVKLTFC